MTPPTFRLRRSDGGSALGSNHALRTTEGIVVVPPAFLKAVARGGNRYALRAQGDRRYATVVSSEDRYALEPKSAQRYGLAGQSSDRYDVEG